MLLELRIQNMALIDSLELEFTGQEGSLVVLTGETGAGKSIILQALHLLAGGRGASSWIRSDSEQAVVEALFSLSPSHAEVIALLAEQDIQVIGEIIIRRIFKVNGRSRFYVNDRLVTAGLVEQLAENLINIASQHDHQQLLVPRRHLDFLDTFGELWPRREEFESVYVRLQERTRRLQQLRGMEREMLQQREYLTHALEEIRGAGIGTGEDETLREERDRLKASGALTELASGCQEILRRHILEHLPQLRRDMERAADLDKGLAGMTERIVNACYEFQDLEGELGRYLDSIPRDQARMEEINERLALLKQLMRKYGATLEAVLEHADTAEADLNALESVEQEIAVVEREVEGFSSRAVEIAAKLGADRRAAAGRLSRAMQDELTSLSFPRALFEVAIESNSGEGVDGIGPTGSDQVEFLFSANPGEPVKPLARIASGGELSRLMLALKCLLARRDQVETVVFDEVDAGIGGKAAEAVAEKIVELAGHHQVICITHLPQIAARANEHFLVNKTVSEDRTISGISLLDPEARVMELARMLGGNKMTEQTIAFARELVTGSNQ